MKLTRFINKTLRLALLLSLLIFAFLLYSVLKIRNAPSVMPHVTQETRQTALYGHVEALSVGIGSRSVYEYERLNAARDYILNSLQAMGYQPELQTYLYEERPYSNVIVTLPGGERFDEVVLFGAPDPDGVVPTASDWARWCGTIGYEIVTRIGERVPRVLRG